MATTPKHGSVKKPSPIPGAWTDELVKVALIARKDYRLRKMGKSISKEERRVMNERAAVVLEVMELGRYDTNLDPMDER